MEECHPGTDAGSDKDGAGHKDVTKAAPAASGEALV